MAASIIVEATVVAPSIFLATTNGMSRREVFTTFSTFAYESNTLFAGGKTGLALLYILVSVSLGILAVYGGQQLIH